ncbi:adenine phosphoribosyltransferase [Diatrype stigma]|uniref:adenine phosphoribosyltransferase n=1 Tax=Diatrype stigma TaxID=117547 RepID=A0AAN9V299_9PEZI
MTAPAPSDSVVESVAPNATTESGAAAASTTTTTTHSSPDASRREPPSSAAGTAQLPSKSLAGKPEEMEKTKQLVISALQYHPDWPTPGVNFIDILPIFRSPAIFAALLDVLVYQIEETFSSNKPEVIVGLDARGFLFGPTLALRLGVPFVPVRKSGKLPGVCFTEVYQKEYGKDEFQIQADSIQKNQKVLIVDDILATGGTAAAAKKLVEQCGGEFLGYLFLIEITVLRGHEQRNLLGNQPLLALVED